MGFWETVGAILVALVLWSLWDRRRSAEVHAREHAKEMVKLLLQTSHVEALAKRLDKRLDQYPDPLEVIGNHVESIHERVEPIPERLEWIVAELQPIREHLERLKGLERLDIREPLYWLEGIHVGVHAILARLERLEGPDIHST